MKDLHKFNPNELEICQDAFVNYLVGKNGIMGEPLCYVVHDEKAPSNLNWMRFVIMYQMSLTGAAYDMDRTSVYHDLKMYLIDTLGFTWTETFDAMEDGFGTYLAWEGHYNGQGELTSS